MDHEEGRLKKIYTVGRQRWFVLGMGVAFLSLVYASLILGARRVGHDTLIDFSPWRAYLSDALRNGIFPFWDPFSNVGVSASLYGTYYPVAIVLGLVFRHTPGVMVAEILLTALACWIGAYGWLRQHSLPVPLALAGAAAYAGSAQVVLDAPNEQGFYVCLSLAPWLLWAVELLTAGTHRRDGVKGTIILTLSLWFMVTAPGSVVAYAISVFVAVYGIGMIFLKRGNVRRLMGYGLLVLLLVSALLFLPTSEFLLEFGGQLQILRGMSGGGADTFNPFTGHLAWAAPLTLWLANGGSLPQVSPGGGSQLYMSAVLAVSIVAGVVTVRLKKEEAWLLGVAGLIILAAMGPFSPVAVFFVNYVPGFSAFRWHYFLGALGTLFLIAVSLRLLSRFMVEGLPQPHLRRRYALTSGLALALLGITTVGLTAATVPASPLMLSWYDIATAVVGGGVSLSVLGWWLWRQRQMQAGLDEVPRPLKLLIISLIGAMTLSFLVVWLFPQQWAISLFRLNIQTVPDLARRSVLGILASNLDERFVPAAPGGILAVDLLQSGLMVGAFILLILRWRSPRASDFAWAVLVLVFCDMLWGAQRYRYGIDYWINTQHTWVTIPRPASVQHEGNDREPALSHLFAPDWQTIRFYENVAIQTRTPTFLSRPIFDTQTFAIMSQAGGVEVFRHLVWLLPQGATATVANWPEVATISGVGTVQLQPNGLEVEINAAQPSRLVWTDTWAPGWRAWVNGKAVEVQRVLGVVKGVDIPGGQSKVVFVYQPPYLGVGLFLMGMSLVSLLLMAVWLSKN